MLRRRALIGLAALACCVPLAASAQGVKIVVLKSADRAAYSTVVAGFAAEARAEIESIVLDDAPAAAGETLAKIAASKPALVLAIGPAAATGARRALSQVPVIFCMVPYYERYGLEAPNVAGIAMAPDFSVELSALKAVAPSSAKVGVLHDPRYSAPVVEELRRAAGEHGFQIVPLETDSEAGVDRALASAHGRVDAMLMVADKSVATAQVVRKLIAFSDAERVPLAALSSSQVKEGAMLSLSASPSSIGQQAGRLANRIIHEKVDPSALSVAPPEELELAINVSAIRKLGGSRDAALDVLRYAARQGFWVRVFE